MTPTSLLRMYRMPAKTWNGQVLRPDAAHRAEQDPAQLTRVDRRMDSRHADAEPLGDRTYRQEMLGPQELRPPQIRRNVVRGGVSTRSIGWILWQA